MDTVGGLAVDSLNDLLRREVFAVDAYKQARRQVAPLSGRSEIVECELSHQRRVERLRELIRQAGGEPAESAGVWGTFAKVVQSGVDVLGERAAVSALEEYEDRGLSRYKRSLPKLDMSTRRIIESELLPEQEKTHSTLSQLKHTIH